MADTDALPDPPRLTINAGALHLEPEASGSPGGRLRLIASWLIVFILLLFGAYALFLFTRFDETPGEYWKTLVAAQFPVVVGLPMAGLGALFLTLVLRMASGPIEVELGGLRFKGGAAPIVFWLICFLAIVGSIKLLWLPA